MKPLTRFGAFVILVSLGFYAGSINSSMLGIDLTTAPDQVVSLFRIGFWSIGLSVLFGISEVFGR